MTVTRSCGWTLRQTRTALRGAGLKIVVRRSQSLSGVSAIMKSTTAWRSRPESFADACSCRSAPVPFSRIQLDVLDLLAAAELVDHVVDELEHLAEQLADGHLALLAEVDQLARRCRSAPRATCSPRCSARRYCAPAQVLRVQLVELDARSPGSAPRARPSRRRASACRRRGTRACRRTGAGGRPTRSSCRCRCSSS